MARTSSQQASIAAASLIISNEQSDLLNNSVPYMYVESAFIPIGATTATVRLVLSAPAIETIRGEYYTIDGSNVTPYKNYGAATSVSNYNAIAVTKFAIPVGGTSVSVTVNLKPTAFAEKYFSVYFANVNGVNAKGKDPFAGLANITAYIVMQSNRSIYASPKYELAYYDDLVTSFEANDLGSGTHQATWSTQIGSGNRYQSGNKEASIYADPILYPTTNPFPIVGGKRQLRVDKLATPISFTQGGVTYTKGYYGSALISKGFIQISRGYVEAKIKLGTARGSWPALWFMPTDGKWPPELDIMEQPLNAEGNADKTLIYTTQHFLDAVDYFSGNHKQVGYKYSVVADGGVATQSDYFVMAAELTDTRWRVYVNGNVMVDVPLRSYAGMSWYILFDNTLGGWGTDFVDPTIVGEEYRIDDAALPNDYGVEYVSVYRDVADGLAPNSVAIMPKVTATRKGAYFDPNGVSCYLALSNGNTTITSAGHKEMTWARSYGCAASGEKIYAKVILSNSDTNIANYFLTFSAGNYGMVMGGTASSLKCLSISRGGSVTINGVSIGTCNSSSADGSSVELCLDRVNNRIWVRVDGGNWNNNVSADPVTNIGGFDTSTFVATLAFLRVACSSSALPAANIGESVTFLTGVVPSGYVSI